MAIYRPFRVTNVRFNLDWSPISSVCQCAQIEARDAKLCELQDAYDEQAAHDRFSHDRCAADRSTWRDSSGSKGMLPPKVGAFHINAATGVTSLSQRAASFVKIVKHAEGSIKGCLLLVPGVGLRAIS